MIDSPAGTKRVLNCIPSRAVEQDWTADHATRAGILAAAPPLPQTVDLRAAWWAIGDQGSTGSCVGWAAADSVARWHYVKAGWITDTDLLSPRFVWMASKETDEFVDRPTTFIETDGTSLKAALDVLRRYGCVRNSVLPFNSGTLFQDEAEVFYAMAAQLKIASYFNLGASLQKWKRWIATQGPILTRLDVDDTWMEAATTNGNLDSYLPDTTSGGHAVALVGYTEDRFIVRNSWGTQLWGDAGFGYASLSYARDAFTEAYGVTL